MMCHRIGSSPISTIGFGLIVVSSESRLPSPPARIPTFTYSVSSYAAGYEYVAVALALTSVVKKS
jgi:hypothetical protein